MQKLIGLLNEFDSLWDYDDYYGLFQYGQDRDAYKYGKYYLVSRDYGFIKWLVEQNKIDYSAVDTQNWNRLQEELDCRLSDKLIMYLSIQDNPINTLVDLLK